MPSSYRVENVEYYELYILKSSAPILTYQSNLNIQNGILVLVPFGKSNKEAIIISRTKEPDFQCKDILEVTNLYFPILYQKIMDFMATCFGIRFTA